MGNDGGCFMALSSRSQAVRNLDDLETMAVPLKYRMIMNFYKYYSGELVAPIPTIFSAFPAAITLAVASDWLTS